MCRVARARTMLSTTPEEVSRCRSRRWLKRSWSRDGPMEPSLSRISRSDCPGSVSTNWRAPSHPCGSAPWCRGRTPPTPMRSIPGSDGLLTPLRGQIKEWIATRVAPAIHPHLLRLLGRPGYALHPDGACRAGTLALTVHEAVGRDAAERPALLAAAALELQMEAAFVFDEVADAVPGAERSEDIGLAIALLTAGAAAATEAAAESPDRAAALDHFCRAYSDACPGQ